MGIRLATLLPGRRHRRMPGLSRWRDELDRLDALLARQSGHPSAWFWQIRRKVLTFLVADRPLATPGSPDPITAPIEARTGKLHGARAGSRPAWERPELFPPPELVLRMHGVLHDLSAANENRYAEFHVMDQAARMDLCIRRRADDIRRSLTVVVSSGTPAGRFVRPLRRDATLDQLHRSLRRETIRACPRCLRRLDGPPPARCSRCGYRCVDPQLTVDDLVTLVRTRLGLPVDGVRPDDLLGELLERRCREVA